MSTESIIQLTNMYTKELDKLRSELAATQTQRDQYATVAQARIEQIQRMEAELVAVRERREVACQTISQLQNERHHRDSFIALSSLSSFLGQGMGGPETSAQDYETRIRSGIEDHLKVASERAEKAEADLAAAREKIAELEHDCNGYRQSWETEKAEVIARGAAITTQAAEIAKLRAEITRKDDVIRRHIDLMNDRSDEFFSEAAVTWLQKPLIELNTALTQPQPKEQTKP